MVYIDGFHLTAYGLQQYFEWHHLSRYQPDIQDYPANISHPDTTIQRIQPLILQRKVER